MNFLRLRKPSRLFGIAAFFSSLTVALLVGSTLAGVINLPFVSAVAGDGATTSITLHDFDNDGTPDGVVFRIDNPNTETWRLQGASPHGLTVTQDGNDISITSVSLTSAADADPVIVRVNLDENDSDMVDNTDGVNEEAIELIYSQVTFGTCDAGATPSICDDTDEELNAIATGDTGATDTETDLMNPVAESVTADRTTIGGIDYSSVAVEYSEAVRVFLDGEGGSEITSGESGTPVGGSGVAGIPSADVYSGLFMLSGEGEGGNVVQNDVNGNTIQLSGDAKTVTAVYNTDASNYWTTGTSGINSADVVTLEDDDDFIEDAAGNGANDSYSVGVTLTTAWDITAPTASNVYSCDSDADGDIDQLLFEADEEMVDASVTVGNFAGDNEDDGSDDETPSSFSTETDGCDGNPNDTDANDEFVRFDFTTGISGTEAAFLNHNTQRFRDWSGNRLALGDAIGTEIDIAAPVITDVTPDDAETDVFRDQDIVVTFSEDVFTDSFEAGDEFDLTPSPGGESAVLSSGNRVLTISHSNFPSNTSINVLLDDDEIDDVNGNGLDLGGPEDGDWDFTTGTQLEDAGNSPQSNPSAPNYIILLEAPNGGEKLNPGDQFEITWDFGGPMEFVNLALTTDGGLTYTSIATNEINDKSYLWTIPNLDISEALIRIQGTDGISILSADLSDDFFTILGTEEPEKMKDDMGESPVNGEIQPVTPVIPGDIIKGMSFDTVYYVTTDMKRRPFTNRQIFFTWHDSFDSVKIVTDATLPTLELGASMLPKPGSVLVKVPSDIHVYAVEEHASDSDRAVKRWIPNEGLATTLYGDNWSDYVIDLPDALYVRFDHGADMTAFDIPAGSMVKRIGA